MKIHKELARLFGFELQHIRKDQPTIAAHLRQLFRLLDINCVIDVGANIGQYGGLLRENGYRGRLISFEPVAATFAELAQNTKTDPAWCVYQCALGAKSAEQEIQVTRSSVFSSFLEPNNYSKEQYPDSVPIVSLELVQIRTLDDMRSEILSDLQNPRIFLKMDTQGYDLEVFAGAVGLLPRIEALQTEISVQPIYAGMPRYLQSLARFQEAGYVLTGLYPVSRDRSSLALIELDCIMRKGPVTDQ